MTLTIRRATAEDAAAVAPLLGELGYPCAADEAARRLAAVDVASGVVALLATDDVGVAGVATIQEMTVLHARGRFAQLTLLVVAARARRRGVGRELVAAAERWARARGCVRLLVASGSQRADAHAFYERLGFEHTSRRYAKVLTAEAAPAAVRIVPIAEEHIEGFRAAVGQVAQEHRYLALLDAPPIEAVREFVLRNIREGHPQFVADLDGVVVGWCDIVPGSRPVYRHAGVLGMGVVKEMRGRGIGNALLAASIEAAKARGLTRIELTVRADNDPARRLYEKFGFVVEGRMRRHMLVDGEYRDSELMSLLVGAES